MESPDALIAATDWSGLNHAYGPASDTPFQLLALLSEDPQTRSAAAQYLDVAILHQGSIYPATGPVALVVAAMLDDPRTMEPVENVLPWDAAPRPLRLELLNFLAHVAESCTFDSEESLQADAHPAGRTETELLQISADADEALRSLGPDASTRILIDRVPVPEALTRAANDKEFQRAIRARCILTCRTVLPEVFAALIPLFDASDARIRVKALEVAARLTELPSLGSHRLMVTEQLETAAASCTDPTRRAAAARLLGCSEQRREFCSTMTIPESVPALPLHRPWPTIGTRPRPSSTRYWHPPRQITGSRNTCQVRRAGCGST